MAPKSTFAMMKDAAQLLAHNWPSALLFALSIAFFVVGWVRRKRQDQRHRSEPPRWIWILSDRGIASVVVAVAALGVIAMTTLLSVAAAASSQPVELAKLRIDSIKYGLGAIAAAGAAGALLIGMRRQRHTEQDSTQRHVTELYTKAAEQLGHAEAAVRLAGLYALERLGQDNEDQRQTIVDVICAYLRMSDGPDIDSDDAVPSVDQKDSVSTDESDAPERRQEIEVRLTAQRILLKHVTLQDGSGEGSTGTTGAGLSFFWPNTTLDLTGAVLHNWSMRNGVVLEGRFGGALFTGYANFESSSFLRNGEFSQARFAQMVDFSKSKFAGNAWFGGSHFGGRANFEEAIFVETAWFADVKFDRAASFSKSSFGDLVAFSLSTFSDSANFVAAKFAGHAWFGAVTPDPGAEAQDGGVTFVGDVDFGRATFARKASLAGARVAARDGRADVWPSGWVLKEVDDSPWALLRRASSG